jgi:glucans biosynthesis protein C
MEKINSAFKGTAESKHQDVLADSHGLSETSLALRNLRGVVIILIVAFHSFSAYIVSQPTGPPPFDNPPYAWRAFPIIDSDRWIGFDLLCAFLFLFLMQLMFFLSGLFVWPSLLRRGWGTFLVHRVLRLGVPFVVGTYLLMPIAYYPVYLRTAVDPAWSAFWSHWTALPMSPAGPLWFLWFLLVLDIGAAVLFRFGQRAHFLSSILNKIVTDPARLFIVLMCVSAAVYFPLAAMYPPWQWIGYGPFEIQAAFAPQYAIYFAAGVALGAFGLERGLLDVNGMPVRRWHYWVLGSIAAFLLWIGPTALIVKGEAMSVGGLQVVADLSLMLFVGTACFGMIAVLLRYGTVRRRIIDQVSENGYGIYFYHYPVVLWLQYAVLGIAFAAIAKGLIVLMGALSLSLAASILTNRVLSTAGPIVNKAGYSVLKSF